MIAAAAENPREQAGAIVTADLLMGTPILGRLTGMQLSALLPYITRHKLTAETPLYRKGDAADTLYLILNGRVRLDGMAGQSVSKATGFAGEESLLGIQIHSGAAHAEDTAEVLAIPAAALEEIAKADAALRQDFFQSYAGRHGDEAPVGAAQPAKPLLGDDTITSILGWVLAIILPLAVYQAGTALGLSEATTDFLAIISVTVCMWLFGLVPEYVPPLFAALAVILLDVAPPDVALSGFQSQSFFMCLSVFGLGALLVSSGVTYRLSLWVLSRVPPTPLGYNLSLFGVIVLLAPIIPSVLGRVVIVSPFLINLIEMSKAGEKDRFSNRLIFSLLGGASLFIPLFLTASVPNLVVYGLFDAQTQFAFSWLSWFLAASVYGLIMLVCFVVVSALMFRGARSFSIPVETIQQQRRVLGKMSGTEWTAILAVLAMVGGILTGPFHQVDVPWIALSIFVSLMLFGTLGRDTLRAKIDWTILIYVGTIVGWVPIATRTGLDALIVENLTWLGAYMTSDFPLFIVFVSAMILVVRLALPTVVTVVLFTTALFPLAIAQGVSLWIVGFVILAIADTFIFPHQSSYYLKLRSDLAAQNLGHICDERRIIVANVILIAFRVAAIYACLVYWTYLGLI